MAAAADILRSRSMLTVDKSEPARGRERPSSPRRRVCKVRNAESSALAERERLAEKVQHYCEKRNSIPTHKTGRQRYSPIMSIQ